MWVLSTKLSFLPWVGTRVPLDAHWQLRENSLLWVTCILQKALLMCWIPRHSVRPLALEKRGRLVAQQCATVSPPYVNKSSIVFFFFESWLFKYSSIILSPSALRHRISEKSQGRHLYPEKKKNFNTNDYLSTQVSFLISIGYFWIRPWD